MADMKLYAVTKVVHVQTVFVRAPNKRAARARCFDVEEAILEGDDGLLRPGEAMSEVENVLEESQDIGEVLDVIE